MFSSSVVTTLAVVFVLSRIVKYHSDKKVCMCFVASSTYLILRILCRKFSDFPVYDASSTQYPPSEHSFRISFSTLVCRGRGIGGTKVWTPHVVRWIDVFITFLTVYEPVGAKTISIVAWLLGDPLIFTTSMEVARQLVTTRGQFEKSSETTAILA